MVNENHPDNIEIADDIKFLKQLLKKKWTHIYKNSKPKKDAPTT